MNLLACPSCSRQYDVTHLEAGDLVRCMCDTVVTVPARAPLPVSALSCTYCGGAVGPDDEACPYCNAKLDEKDRVETTLCPHCFTRIPDRANHCYGCGVEIRPQALTPIPAGKSCPRCKGKLQIRSLELSDVIECADCKGVWIRADVFDAICRDAERRLESSLLTLRSGEGRAAPESKVEYIPCLKCGQLMNRRQYRHNNRASGVVVDICRDHGVWLDHEELEQVVAFIRRSHGGMTNLASIGLDGLDRRDSGKKEPRRPLIAPSQPQSPLTEALRFIGDLLLGG